MEKTSDIKLNKDQRRAVEAPPGPILIIAGAGTGKTKTLTNRVISLIKNGVPPEKICVLTFTNKAAKEILERVSDNADIRSGRVPFLGTFHSFGARILHEEANLLGRKNNFVIFDSQDSFQLIKKIAKKFLFRLKRKSEQAEVIKPAVFQEEITAVKNGMIDLDKLRGSPKLVDNLSAEIFDKYEEGLKENNAFDFDDLIQKVVEVFKKYPTTLQKYQCRIEHFLVDEYQDINNVQYEMVKLLASEKRNLSVVGDHNQTIYSWRGSNLEIFLNFENDWENAMMVFLGENYRSTKNIIEAASGLIKNNTIKPKRLKEDSLFTNNERGELVNIIETETEEEEAFRIAEEIKNLKRDDDGRIAILYRLNAQSRALEQALIEHDIPYQIFGGLKFYERLEIKDILAALRSFFNPSDSLSKERLEKNLGKRRTETILDALRSATGKKPAQLIDIFLQSADYFEHIERTLINPNERKENIAELIVFATGFEEVGQFLERVTLLQATDNVKKEEKFSSRYVQLMTVHMAKGLEFDTVFVAGVNEGILPHHRSLGEITELEEERRLAYVAMTRAKKKLYLSFYNIPSRFLGEIPPELTIFKGERALNDEERWIDIG
ncbi:MAG: UvrD-helicase domain-containing protein [Candidatus Paceibacterota bacterium]